MTTPFPPAEVEDYMRSRARLYANGPQLNTTALAHDAAARFGLWVDRQNVPEWVNDLAAKIAARHEDTYWDERDFAGERD